MLDGTSLVTSDWTEVWVSAIQPSDGEHGADREDTSGRA